MAISNLLKACILLSKITKSLTRVQLIAVVTIYRWVGRSVGLLIVIAPRISKRSLLFSGRKASKLSPNFCRQFTGESRLLYFTLFHLFSFFYVSVLDNFYF